MTAVSCHWEHLWSDTPSTLLNDRKESSETILSQLTTHHHHPPTAAGVFDSCIIDVHSITMPLAPDASQRDYFPPDFIPTERHVVIGQGKR
jgi:hypothetical protein